MSPEEIVELYRNSVDNKRTSLADLSRFRHWLREERGVRLSAAVLRRIIAAGWPPGVHYLPRRQRFPRRYYNVASIDTLWCADTFYLAEKTMKANYVTVVPNERQRSGGV